MRLAMGLFFVSIAVYLIKTDSLSPASFFLKGCSCASVIETIAFPIFSGSVYVEDDYIRLVSLNDDIDFEGNRLFPDILLPRDENTRIIGKVIEAFTPIEKV